MQPEDVTAIFQTLRAANPEPRSELHYANPFQLLVAVILSAQATDISVNKVTPALFRAAPDAAAMRTLGEDGIRELIRTIGLFNNKARNLHEMCRQLLERWDGEVPQEREALQALAGVGRKTANVVLNVAFGQETLAVDTHIFRVANRTGLAPGKTPEAVEQGLLATIPGEFRRHAHHWLILHGRYVCKARQPLCPTCGLRPWCTMGRELDGNQLSGTEKQPKRAGSG